MAEQWADIPGYRGDYQVSDEGRVRSFKRGRVKILSARDDGRGYMKVWLWLDARGRHFGVHSLVAAAFIGTRPDGHEVRHRDGNRSSNHIGNLRYGTSSENTLDAVQHGTHNMARKTHCLRGHEFTEANTKITTLRTGSPARRCRACGRDKATEQRRAKRERISQ